MKYLISMIVGMVVILVLVSVLSIPIVLSSLWSWELKTFEKVFESIADIAEEISKIKEL